MRCEVRPPLIAMLAAQRVEQPVRVVAVALVERQRPTVRDVPMRTLRLAITARSARPAIAR